MIIQCKRCETKYRFDESLITGEGVWVRCSRCSNVFFQEAQPPADRMQQPLEASLPAAAEREQIRPVREAAKAAEKEAVPVGAGPAPAPAEKRVLPAAAEEVDELDIDKAGEDLDDLSLVSEEKEEKPVGKGRKRGILTPGRIVLYGILLVILLAAVFFRFFPGESETILQGIFRAIPAVERLWAPEKTSSEFNTRQIGIQDVRQRFVNSGVLGKLRVVEGAAVNTSSFAVARIKIKGELYDAYGVVLTDRVAYAGNILVDEALWVLTEEAIQSELSSPRGNTASNERVPPNGKIPFMVVFAHEPTGVAKATVMVASAEKILP